MTWRGSKGPDQARLRSGYIDGIVGPVVRDALVKELATKSVPTAAV